MIAVLLGAILAADPPLEAPAPTAESLRFFEANVRPILVEHCFKCHGADKQWAGLRLDSREALFQGGDSGPVVVPGKPDDSPLIRAIRQTDENLRMPQEGALTERQIADLTTWVEQGAPFPETPAVGKRLRDPNHWAFQAPIDHAPPDVVDAAWPRSPLDRFVLARLEAAGIAPAPVADKIALVRRATFDLTGLPPTPEQVTAFITDESPDAYERLIDRLLASPAYGERWGRHWLDVARYADSNGLDENVAHGNAWRYRDYVVAAFNRDEPFDRFLVAQLAGDLLPASNELQRHEQLIATGFLSIGPKVLAEVDQAKMQMDIVDEQIDALGRVFLGLTLGCARCHDHKFDPIDAADYYGLAGIFKSTRTMDTYTKVAKWHEHPLPSPEANALATEHQSKVAAQKRIVEDFIARADQKVKDSLPADAKPPEKLETLYADADKTELARLREELAKLEKNPPELPSAMGVTEDAIVDVAIHVRGNPLKLGEVVPRRAPAVVRGPEPPRFSPQISGRRELAAWLVDPRHPLTARVVVNRVWRWHFGRGLVRSTENFGLLGESPSHPELLDWLALRFMADGWSLKSLHRLILTSATYRQSSLTASEQIARDADNRLFGRANVRRLEAEEVRDSLLAVSGRLDATMGGSLLKVKNRDYFFDHTSKDLTEYDSVRRSLYLPVVRNNVYDVFQLLDFPDPAVPTGDRTTTTVAPQALLMLNSDLVMQASDELSRRLLTESEDDDQRQSRLYAIAYGREPTAEEIQANARFLVEVERSLSTSVAAAPRAQAWAALCHAVLSANEFIYLR